MVKLLFGNLEAIGWQATRTCRNGGSGSPNVVRDGVLGWLLGGGRTEDIGELGKHSCVGIILVQTR